MSALPGGLPVDTEGWAAFFGRFEDVVLVANSDAADIDALGQAFGNGALFVFFNKTYKVLSGRFERPSLLVARSSEAGANIVYRREVEAVVRPLSGPSFQGVLNLKAAPAERFSPLADFGNRAVGRLDLSGHFAGFYPAGVVPSSGFALAVWLAERGLARRIHLAGFSARRSGRWKLFPVHDWTFEQTLLRLLLRSGALHAAAPSREATFDRICERFPGIAPEDVAAMLAEVLSERLANTDAAVDRLFSLTRWQAKLEDAFRAVKPRTRKQRLQAAGEGGKGEDGLAKNDGGD